MTPDEAAAALSFATHLSEGLMPKGQPEEVPLDPSQSPEMAPGQEQAQNPEEDAFKKEVGAALADLDARLTELSDRINAPEEGAEDPVTEPETP